MRTKVILALALACLLALGGAAVLWSAGPGSTALPADLVLEGVSADDVREMLQNYEAVNQAREAGDFAAYRAAVSRAYFAQGHNIEAMEGKAFDAAHFTKLPRFRSDGRGKLIAVMGNQEYASLVHDTEPKALPGGSYPLSLLTFLREGGKWKFGSSVATGTARLPSTSAEWQALARAKTYPHVSEVQALRRPVAVPASKMVYTGAKLLLKINGTVVTDTRAPQLGDGAISSDLGMLKGGLKPGRNTVELEYEPLSEKVSQKTTIKITGQPPKRQPLWFEKEIGPQEKGTLAAEFTVEAQAQPQECQVCDEAGVLKEE